MTQNEFDDAVSRLTQKGVKGIDDDATGRLFSIVHTILRDRRERHGIDLPNDWCASKREIAAFLRECAANGKLHLLKEDAEAVEMERIPVAPTTSSRQ